MSLGKGDVMTSELTVSVLSLVLALALSSVLGLLRTVFSCRKYCDLKLRTVDSGTLNLSSAFLFQFSAAHSPTLNRSSSLNSLFFLPFPDL